MNFAEVWEAIQDAGLTAGNQIQKNAKRLSKYDKEDILAAVGLEPKRSAFEVAMPAIGFFAVGVLAGVGLGMLFAPKAGYELREDLTEQIKGIQGQSQTSKPQTGNATAGNVNNEINPVI